MGQTFPLPNLQFGMRFINLDSNFDDLKLLIYHHEKGNPAIPTIGWFNDGGPPTVVPFDGFQGDLFPDFQYRHFTPTDDLYIKLKFAYLYSWRELKSIIYASPNKRILISEYLIFFRGKGINKKAALAFLKLFVAHSKLAVTKNRKAQYVFLERGFEDFENQKKFLSSIADEIISKSDRVELLIPHAQTKGNYREVLVRSVLQKYLPNKYQVATGFVEGCKRQCDIIIYDAHNYSPFFRENELVVVPPSSVRGIIEVKSNLNSKSLKEALDLLGEFAHNRNEAAPIFKGVFAFKTSYKNVAKIADVVKEFYQVKPNERYTREISYLYETVNSICVINNSCIISDLIDYSLKDTSIRPRLYSVHALEVIKHLHPESAFFFNELFTFLDVEKHAKKVNVKYFKMLDSDVNYKLENDFYDEKWKPNSFFEGEHYNTFSSIWERVSDVTNWKHGFFSTQDLHEKYFSHEYTPIDFFKRFGDMMKK